MKKGKYVGIWLSILFLVSGGYIVQDCMTHPGNYADAWLMVGAVLSALSLPSIAWFVRSNGQTRALHRHMRSH